VQARIVSDHIRAVTPYENPVIPASLAETAQVMETTRDDIFVAILET
jgi:hypothetical protein